MDLFINVARVNGVKGKIIYNSITGDWVCALERIVNVQEEIIKGKGGTLEEALWDWRNEVSELKIYLQEKETHLVAIQLPIETPVQKKKEEAKV